MTTIDWSSLQTFADWAKALDDLLTHASSAVAASDTSQKVEAQKSLKTFIDKSPNPMADRLDAIAKQAINDIFADTLEKSMAAIGSRTAELASLVKTIQAITGEAEQDAASIRLEKAKRVVDATTETVQALLDLRATLKDGATDQALGSDIEKVVAAIQKLRSQVETVGHG